MSRLRQATGPEQQERDRLTHPAWGARLGLEDWLVREARLRAHRWPRAAMTSWLWTEGDSVLASCETFCMDSVLGSTPGHTYGVASVFVEAALRGRGHARAMMRALVARLPEEDPQAQASILFSDVGTALYEAAGYVARPAGYLDLAAGSDPWPQGVAPVHEDEVPASIPPPPGRFVVVPSAAQIDWHLERERYYAETLGRPRPRHPGARAGDEVALWTADHKNDRLDLLVLDLASPRREALVAAAGAAAREAGLARLRVWTGAPPRDDSLPMIAPLAPGLGPSDWTWIPRALWV